MSRNSVIGVMGVGQKHAALDEDLGMDYDVWGGRDETRKDAHLNTSY